MSDETFAATKDRPGTYDAIQTAKPGEPLFPIQGGDPLGPPTVIFWVDLCRKAGMAESNPKRAQELLRKASDAEHIAWQMIDYQRGVEADARPAAEAVSAPVTAYSGWTDDADEETMALRRQRQERIATTGILHNLVAIATERATALAQMRCCPEAEVKIREAIERLREAALEIEPRRGTERS